MKFCPTGGIWSLIFLTAAELSSLSRKISSTRFSFRVRDRKCRDGSIHAALPTGAQKCVLAPRSHVESQGRNGARAGIAVDNHRQAGG